MCETEKLRRKRSEKKQKQKWNENYMFCRPFGVVRTGNGQSGQMGLKSSMKNKLSWQVVGHCDVALWSRWCHLFGLIQFILLAKLLPSNLKVLRLNSVKSNRHSEKTSTHRYTQTKQTNAGTKYENDFTPSLQPETKAELVPVPALA